MHDKNGVALAKGDKVLIEGVLSDCQSHADYCNCTVTNLAPLPAGQVTFSVTLNTKQTLKCCETLPAVTAPAFSLLDVQELAAHVIHLLQTQGDTAIDLVNTTLRLIQAATGRNMLAVFAELNNEIRDINKIVAAVKAEFNIA